MNRHKGELPNIRGCSPKEMALIAAYMENGFVQKAALRTAGYTGHSGYIFKKEIVRTEIQRRVMRIETDRQNAYTKAKQKCNITKERLYHEYAKMAFAPMKGCRVIKSVDDWTGKDIEFYDVTQEQRDIGADIPVDARDKRAALDSLAKMEGLFVEHLKISDEREIVANLIAGRKRAAAKQLNPPGPADD